MARPPMAHRGARPTQGPRIAKPILAPPFAVLPHPDRKGVWVVTHWSVLAGSCDQCGSVRGELCQDSYGTPPGRYSVTTHSVRRTETRASAMVRLALDPTIRFPQARDWLDLLGDPVPEIHLEAPHDPGPTS